MKAKEILTGEDILDTVVYRMVDRKTNGEILKKVPHKCLLDLAAVYYCIFDLENGSRMGMLMGNDTCRHYGIPEEELDAAAGRNTEAGGFSAMKLRGIPGLPGGFPESMWVLTNRKMLYGASVILYGDYLRGLAGQLGADLYILPSSIHEVIAVTVSGMDPSDLQDIVKKVNGMAGVIRKDEVLSNNMYRYSRDGGLTCVTLDGKKTGSTTG